MTPRERYQQAIAEQHIKKDSAQHDAVERLEDLYQKLLQHRSSSLQQLLSPLLKPQHITGVYLWGGTGRGKTFLMDNFYACLAFPEKHRLHFHRFMCDIHRQIRQLPHVSDPLKIIARQWAKQYRLLCLDEFHVTDITDAMILARLLEALFKSGITLVMTSNIAISDLYKDGLQRSSFLPAIDLLHQHTEEVPLGAGTDYRYEYLELARTYYLIQEHDAEQELNKHFANLTDANPKHNRTIIINDREIRYKAWSNDIIWFEFSDLCRTARSAIDYLEIARSFEAVFISNIECMNDEQNDIARRFIHLIDALYDHRVKVFATAQAEPDTLYTGKILASSFGRAVSRLHEMATRHYLGEAHH
jgi:cell division protein ZapE